MKRIDLGALQKLPPAQREEAEALLKELEQGQEANPLERWHSCPSDCGLPGCKPRVTQHAFLVARDPVQAAFAGNQFGKTSGLVVKALCQLLPDEFLPERLRGYRIAETPAYGRIVGPDLSAWLYGVFLPTLRDWTPRGALLGQSFEKAWDKQRRVLRFDNGSWLQAMTYEMDLDKFGGSRLDFVGYDEPPPQDIRNECAFRLVARDGFEMFALTPLMGIGWLYRDIWKKREQDGITVVKGSIHDNPYLSKAAVKRTLDRYPEGHPERAAREHGDFAHFGGMVYVDWRKHILQGPPEAEEIRGRDVVVGIDPAYTKSAFIWVAFDGENKALVFHEEYVEKGNVLDYVRAIRRGNAKWGLRDPLYVMDPYHGHKHGMTDGQTVAEEFARQGIHTCNPVVLDKDAIVYGGVQQIWRRMAQQAFKVSPDCYRLSEEAEEYRIEDRPDGVFQVVKENDDGLDACRYALTWRPWYPHEETEREPELWEPGMAPSQDWLTGARSGAPMGSMS